MAKEKQIKSFDHSEPVITFHTWKKSLKGKEGYYNAKNETLLGIQCAIADERMEQSNWVEKDSIFIIEKLGAPQKKAPGQFYYFKKNQLIIFNFNRDKVDWFKYFLLAKPVENTDFENKKLTEWIPRRKR